MKERQEDAIICLRYILSMVLQDTNEVNDKPYWEDTPTAESQSDEKEKAKETWDRYIAREASPLINLVTGMYRKITMCRRCTIKNPDYYKSTFEVFSVLPLGINFT
jgi:ubiquitin C-terminal hydrolase